MKIIFIICLSFLSVSASAQSARDIARRACEHGAKLYSDTSIAFARELWKIASETEANSPQRITRLKSLEGYLDDHIGRTKMRNKGFKEEWISQGIKRDVADLHWSAVEASLYISLNLARENPRWEVERLKLEVQEKCEQAAR